MSSALGLLYQSQKYHFNNQDIFLLSLWDTQYLSAPLKKWQLQECEKEGYTDVAL